jgi:hypothetical protein
MLSYLFTRDNKTFLLVVECKADLTHNFISEMKCSFPEYRKGLTKWKAEIGDCVQGLSNEALLPKCSFSWNEGNMLNRIKCNHLLYT